MNEKMKILVVDDEEAICASLKDILEEEGYDVYIANSAMEAEEKFSSIIDLVLLDIKLGNDNGIELLKKLKKTGPAIPVIMISGHGTIALAATAFKLGAHEFMEKPLRLIQVRACVRNALEAVKLKHKVSDIERKLFETPLFCSETMKNIFQQTSRLASISEPVIIMGPSGSGKELVARSLHYDGGRRDGPFIATNAASMPVNLAEDELFGHEKGAFTGAQGRRKGCIEQADGGTLFLDEIADLDIQIQAKLLRVLENSQFIRLGGSEIISVNTRIIAATHKDLHSLVQQGLFRNDLWYRLCAFIIKIPSLEERREDIPLLASHFLNKACQDMGIHKSFSNSAIQLLSEGKYPGNVRELKHIVTRAAVFSDMAIIDEKTIHQVTTTAILPNKLINKYSEENNYSSMDYKTAREKFEIDYFSSVLANNNSNITAAAASIGMAQSNLSRKLKELGIR